MDKNITELELLVLIVIIVIYLVGVRPTKGTIAASLQSLQGRTQGMGLAC